MVYITNIEDPSITNIYAFSDIHSDIHSLIISLRDCAKVIQKKSDSDYDLERLLNINIQADASTYIEDLGYEWIGSNKHVVIIGDILDGNRGQTYPTTKTITQGDKVIRRPDHEYPQIEIKILLFINSINDKAKDASGRIHKIFGNHEITNILFNIIKAEKEAEDVLKSSGKKSKSTSSFDTYKKQIFDSAQNEEIYYNGYTRYNVFNPKNPGYELLLKDGCGILLKINNNIFVHGSLSPISITEIDDINNIINNPDTSTERLIEILKNFGGSYTHKNKAPESLKNTGSNKMYLLNNLVYARHYGIPFLNNSKFKLKGNDQLLNNEHLPSHLSDKINNYVSNDEAIATCGKVTDDLRIFMGTDDPTIINNLRIIVGHCIQQAHVQDYSIKINDITTYDVEVESTTYSNIVNSDSISETLQGANHGKQNILENRIFGITMECPITDNLYQVYRVDIGSSRAQDYYRQYKDSKNAKGKVIGQVDDNDKIDSKLLDMNINTFDDEKNYLFSRTPQVLYIERNDSIDNISIIRSKMKNTRINQPRSKYESYINSNNISVLKLDNQKYQKKYLKYKTKYINLKQSIR